RSRNTDRLALPSRANPEAAARILPGRTLIRLHSTVSPTPLATAGKDFVRLYRYPVRARRQDRWHAQGDRVGAAAYDEWLGSGRIDLRARKARTVGVKEDIEIIGNAGSAAIKGNPIGVNRLHRPSLTTGHHKIVSNKIVKRRKIRELLRARGVGRSIVVLVIENHLGSFRWS